MVAPLRFPISLSRFQRCMGTTYFHSFLNFKILVLEAFTFPKERTVLIGQCHVAMCNKRDKATYLMISNITLLLYKM
jgi:hypothetical protein